MSATPVEREVEGPAHADIVEGRRGDVQRQGRGEHRWVDADLSSMLLQEVVGVAGDGADVGEKVSRSVRYRRALLRSGQAEPHGDLVGISVGLRRASRPGVESGSTSA